MRGCLSSIYEQPKLHSLRPAWASLWGILSCLCVCSLTVDMQTNLCLYLFCWPIYALLRSRENRFCLGGLFLVKRKDGFFFLSVMVWSLDITHGPILKPFSIVEVLENPNIIGGIPFPVSLPGSWDQQSYPANYIMAFWNSLPGELNKSFLLSWLSQVFYYSNRSWLRVHLFNLGFFHFVLFYF